MNALEVRDVSKKFRIYHEKHETLKETVLFRRRATFEELWAVKDVSFTVKAGEMLGIIGENGSGKSTLLKILVGILRPEQGKISVNGKVSALLELGAGFHPELTGRENIYLNGAILQLSRREIDRKFDDIVAFSELENFIDLPVKNYSSGMYGRLGFAVAVNVNPDILLIDEVLAVGDQFFQAKCLGKINEFKRNGKTIVLVTHDLDMVNKICDRAILMNNGVIMKEGKPQDVIQSYRVWVAEKERLQYSKGESGQSNAAMADRFGTKDAEIVSCELLNSSGSPSRVIESGSEATIRAAVKFNQEVADPIFGMIIRAEDGTYLYDTNTLWQGMKSGVFKAGEFVDVKFEQKVLLTAGTYLVTLAVAYSDASRFCDWWTDCFSFHISDTGKAQGRVNLLSKIILERSRAGVQSS